MIKPQFDVVMPFKGGLSRVWKGIESNYINKDGVYVVPRKSGAVAAQGVPQSLSIIPKEPGLGTSEQLTRKTLAVFDFKLDKRGANFVHSEKSSNDSVIPQDRPEAIKVPFSKCQGEDYFALAGLPAEIGYAPVGGGCTIENHSTKRIVRYRLGCVTQLNGELNILRSDDETHVNLPPADLIAGRFPLEILNLRQIDKTCKTAGRKLAIVELTFADGVMWDLAALNQMNR